MNATLTKISVESLKIDGHSVSVPEGLSELLEQTWGTNERQVEFMPEYDRKVIKGKDGFVTFLSKKILKP
jgi:hypothetical protein